MPPKFDEELAHLWTSGQYRSRVALVQKMRPIVPEFNYAGDSNIEEIKFKLAQQRMFDAMMALLKPKEQ